ncbi:AcrR family transcriptional regulator [Actinoplanes tereljensis]|uniref:TetR family transcriptional regulator n=1 Tax=Paractinoplanes tereljensis TaxID=571912 RepID=A0A919NPR9_9ACTN|nr:TetR/AcrR family transcriptional regulator [Actinoplanes tereljensis]GIF21632.1 TetR family transcriptional regulator [Actinoplanes tereljensis]
MRSPTVDVSGGRKRPKDRKAQIAQVAAELFCARGYHGVGLEEIAAAVGISAPAVYRHFENKYAILVFATRGLVDSALTATSRPPEEDGWATLEDQLEALARLATTHRDTSGLYQWEWRYLTPEHRAEFGDDLTTLLRRLATPLSAARPALTPADAAALARAALSIFGSLGTHRAAIAKTRAEQALRQAAYAVLHDEPPTPAVAPARRAADPGLRSGSRREIVLAESIQLFREHGYHAVNIEDIGAAAGINASSVYRYFPGKANLLAAAFYRASERVSEATATALAGATNDVEALHRMIESYVDLTFERSDLVSVYLAENNNLPESDRHELRKVQRLHVEEWVRLLGAVRPDLPTPEVRVLVHAAINLVTDLSRWVRFDRGTGMDRHLVRLMTTVLGLS